MKYKKLKTLTAVIVLTLSMGIMPSVPSTVNIPAVTTTVEAASRKLSLKASNKKGLCRQEYKDLSKSHQRGKTQL